MSAPLFKTSQKMKILLINITMLLGMTSAENSLFDKHYIGQSKEKILEIIQTEHKGLKLNTTNVNKAYNYLKFEDEITQVTAIFFLAQDDRCYGARIVSAYSNFDEFVAQLNDKYTKENETTWTYKKIDRTFQVALEKGDWFFTLLITEKREV